VEWPEIADPERGNSHQKTGMKRTEKMAKTSAGIAEPVAAVADEEQDPSRAAVLAAEAIYRAAVKRRLARRDAAELARMNYPSEKLRAELEGRTPPPRPDWSGPACPAPTNSDEWVDDQLTAASCLAHDPAARAVYAILEASRQGPAAAASAVHGASGLAPSQQYAVFRSLSAMSKGSFARGPAAALDKFRALGLAEDEPVKDAQQQLDEWVGVQIARAGPARGPAATVIEILEALRAGPEALAAAVATADHLSVADRAAVEAALRRLPVAGPLEIHNAQRAALAAWVAATRSLASRPRGREAAAGGRR
jgi:hypothetical protein